MSCNNNCNTCDNLFVATAIDLSDGIMTIDVPETFIPKECDTYCILLRVAIPTGSTCNRIIINNLTTKYDVLNSNGNYWRPCVLKCRSILKMKFFGDPEHFVIKQVKK